jgi:ATP-dependent protease ClpP protease subunit
MTILVDGELVLYGFVGDDFWDAGFTASQVIDALAELGHDADVPVRLNSGGGYTEDGIAIYNALAAHGGKVSIQIDAIAASAASLIAMAGDEITMRTGALMMIHDPSRGTWGTASDHEKSQAQLDKLGNLMAGIYAAKSGEDIEDIRSEMKDELWLTGEETVERGFADASESGKSKAVAAFDYRAYAHAPKQLLTKSKKQGWSFEALQNPAASAATPKAQKPTAQKKEPPSMTKPGTPDNSGTPQDPGTAEDVTSPAGVLARVQAILDSEEGVAAPRLAKHFAFKTSMSSEEAIEALQHASGSGSGSGSPEDGDTKPEANKGNGGGGGDPAGYGARRSQASQLAPPAGGSAPDKTKAALNPGAIYASRAQTVAAKKGT